MTDSSSKLEVEDVNGTYLLKTPDEVKGQLEWDDGAWIFVPSWADEERWDDLQKSDEKQALDRAKKRVTENIAG